jgi:hypothetical protein
VWAFSGGYYYHTKPIRMRQIIDINDSLAKVFR